MYFSEPLITVLSNSETMLKPIHPFPARMAPEILGDILGSLSKGSTILDPMTGSGTVIRTALNYGHMPIGVDTDPLAVLLSKVWTTPIDTQELKAVGQEVLSRAKKLDEQSYSLTEDEATQEFINFWFAPTQKRALTQLSQIINSYEGPVADALRVAMSRLIITKDKGASLGKDVSHSRPHKKGEENNFDVFEGFNKSILFLCKRMHEDKLSIAARVEKGDSRNLITIEDNSIDTIITSPPYLNAVDYMRGHKLSLVWFGHTIKSLSTIRSNSIGAERQPDKYEEGLALEKLLCGVGTIGNLSNSLQKMIHRYAFDMSLMLKESKRVLKNNSQATFVIGNSCLRGNFIKNTEILKNAAMLHGLKVVGEVERELPPNKRYLPPPSAKTAGIQNRMRTESIITVEKVSQ